MKFVRRLLVQILQLHPLIAGEMIRQPRLPALCLAANPVAHDESLVGVPLQLDDLPIGELSGVRRPNSRIGRHRLHPEIELVESPESARDTSPSGTPLAVER